MCLISEMSRSSNLILTTHPPKGNESEWMVWSGIYWNSLYFLLNFSNKLKPKISSLLFFFPKSTKSQDT